jgi:hypothetical protein
LVEGEVHLRRDGNLCLWILTVEVVAAQVIVLQACAVKVKHEAN